MRKRRLPGVFFVDSMTSWCYTIYIIKKEDMMKYKLFQIHLTEAEYNKVNAEGHDSVPKQVTKLDMSFSENTGALAKKAMNNNWYTHVSNITATNIEDVFKVGNMGPEENIERLAPMYSVSVGDVVEDETGSQFVCASFGWKEVA